MFRYEIVGDVRGKGLMIGIEMVEDKASKKPLNGVDMMKIWDQTKDSGVLIGQFFFSNLLYTHFLNSKTMPNVYNPFSPPPPKKKDKYLMINHYVKRNRMSCVCVAEHLSCR